MDNHHFEVVRHDVTYPYSAEVDEIYNLACPASPMSIINMTRFKLPKHL